MSERVGLADGLVAGLVAAFLLSNAVGLGAVPLVHEDEPWIAAPGYEFATVGRFQTPLFKGFFGSERHFYGFQPLYSMMVGASLRVFGVGLVQARAVSLALAALVLVLTHLLARRLLTAAHGVVAVAILAAWPIASPSLYRIAGIPLTDLARLSRYDVAVPVFGLAALLVIAPSLGSGNPKRTRAFVAGLLCGFAMLCHVYGGAFLAAVALWLIAEDGRNAAAPVGFSIAGFAVATAPWLVFALEHPPDFIGQNLEVGDRFQLLSPGFYAQNLLNEWRRYVPIAQAALRGGIASWVWVVCVAAGLLASVRATALRSRGQRLLILAVASIAGLFAFLLRPQRFDYLSALFPFFSLLAAVGIVNMAKAPRGLRGALAVLVLLATAEGLGAYARLWELARATTPYAALCDRLAAKLPPGTRLLALPNYWFGLTLRIADYRSLLVPISLAGSGSTPKVTLAQALERDPPDTLLVDPATRRFLGIADNPAAPYRLRAAELRAYLGSPCAGLAATMEDSSYGRFEFYRLSVPCTKMVPSDATPP